MQKGVSIFWAVAFGIVIAGIYFSFFNLSDGENRQRNLNSAIPVQVASIHEVQFSDILEALGTARANESVDLTARVSETVEKVYFDDGQMIEIGEILVELTNSEERAQVAEAEANAKEAQQQYDRVADLVRTGNASGAVLDERLRALEAARSRLEASKARLADRIIRAPFSGVLGLRNISPGALVSPGTIITTLDDVDLIKLDFSVPERFIASLAQGRPIVALAAAFPDRIFEGAVATISPRVDPVTRAITIRAEMPNPDRLLRPGMLLTIKLINDERMTLAVPAAALVPVGSVQYVYVLGEHNRVARTAIITGQRQNDFVEVLSGLQVGDEVVVSGTMRLRDGSTIRIPGREIEQDQAQRPE